MGAAQGSKGQTDLELESLRAWVFELGCTGLGLGLGHLGTKCLGHNSLTSTVCLYQIGLRNTALMGLFYVVNKSLSHFPSEMGAGGQEEGLGTSETRLGTSETRLGTSETRLKTSEIHLIAFQMGLRGW